MQFEMLKDDASIIKVIGVGGGGGNAINHMYKQGIKGVDFIICNTDAQALELSPIPNKIQLGSTLTEGRGAGSMPEVGKHSAIENIEEIKTLLGNTKMVFITAGMGGGTGTGASPIIAQACREMGILTVGIVTTPFAFEGKRRRLQAEEGLEELKKNVDTLLVISNDKMREMFGNLTLSHAFGEADDILTTAAKGIAEIITVPGYINVDFEDVRTVMKDSGAAIMGSCTAKGEDRARKAVVGALSSPLLNDNEIEGARYILLNISSGINEVLMDEVTIITDYIQEEAGLTADIIWGNCFDSSLEDELCVTIIATGFQTRKEKEIGKQKAPEKIVKVLRYDELLEESNTHSARFSNGFSGTYSRDSSRDGQYEPSSSQAEPASIRQTEPYISSRPNEHSLNFRQNETTGFTRQSDTSVNPRQNETIGFPRQSEPSVSPRQNGTSASFRQGESSDFFHLNDSPASFGQNESSGFYHAAESSASLGNDEPSTRQNEPSTHFHQNETSAGFRQNEPLVSNRGDDFKTEEPYLKTETFIHTRETFTVEENIEKEPFIRKSEISQAKDPFLISADHSSQEVKVKNRQVSIFDQTAREEASKQEPIKEGVNRLFNTGKEKVEPSLSENPSKAFTGATSLTNSFNGFNPAANTAPLTPATPSTHAEENSEDDPMRKTRERIMRLKELSMKLRTSKGIEDLENVPAYIRKQQKMDKVPYSSHEEESRYTTDEKGEIRPNNSFLHDNVD